MKPKRFLAATLGGQGAMLDHTDAEIKLFEQLAAYIEKGSMRTLVSLILPKGQPMPSEEVMKQAEASFRGGQDLAAPAAGARSLRTKSNA